MQLIFTLRYFRFYGTNAYWAHMTTDEEMDRIFHDIATIGIRIVRTWAFNDVSCKPKSGPYFQVCFASVLFHSFPTLRAIIDSEKWGGYDQRRS